MPLQQRSMNDIEQYLENKLAERRNAGNLRQLRTAHAEVDFFSNDYLGIAANNIINTELINIGSGSTGSRLLSGNSEATETLESQIAIFQNAPAALLFNSGYNANIGLLVALANRDTVFLYDELSHASIIDGIRLSIAAGKYKFKHNNIADLEAKLKNALGKTVFIVVESIYSMDGDAAPLEELCALALKYNAALIVDEAHGTGVFGKHGEGLVQELNLQHKVFARVHTFGKALGCHGAAVVGSKLLREYLINFARPFIYTTALPPHAISTITNAYKYLSSDGFSNAGLHELIAYFRTKIAAAKDQDWKDSSSPIQAIIVGGNERTRKLADTLQQNGLQIQPILHPTVPIGTERLRICIHAFNTKAEIDLLFTIINDFLCKEQ